MKVSVIVSVYKDVNSLSLIMDALQNQTYKNFEVVVVEDGNAQEMTEYIKTVENLLVKHTTQEDSGVRKARSQNNGILASTGEYLIFIDGDCIPHTHFIKGHVTLAEDKTVLSGRRMNIPINLAKKIRDRAVYVSDIENHLWKYSTLMFNKNVRFRQGIYIDPKGWFYRLVSKRDASASILGCNFSCFKKDMVNINGFDEGYGETAIPDDMDWEWRFKAYGLKLKSCKNVANIYHLDHTAHDRGDATFYLNIMNERKKNKQYICEAGLNTHE